MIVLVSMVEVDGLLCVVLYKLLYVMLYVVGVHFA